MAVEASYIEPGSPWDNNFAENFHGRLRDEYVALEAFDNLTAARTLAAEWKDDYNHRRQHNSLGYQPPLGVCRRV